MNRLEQMMDDYSDLTFNFKNDMHDKHGAFLFGTDIYINSKQPYEQKTGYLAEEIGHQETSVGDISTLDTIEKCQQERRARQWGYRYLVSLDDLIVCQKFGLTEYWEIAEFLEITTDYLWKSINYYKESKGITFQHTGCQFVFGIADSLKIIFPSD